MKNLFLVFTFLTISLLSYCPSMDYSAKDYKAKMVNHLVAVKKEFKRVEFNRFLYDLGHKESNNNWKAYNSAGYIGEYQFGKLALKEVGLGHITFRKFKKDPSIFSKKIQLKAVTMLIDINFRLLSKYIEEYEGETIGNILVTKSGLLAACHLGGARSVKLFLITNGRVNRYDSNSTSIGHYLLLFKNYKF